MREAIRDPIALNRRDLRARNAAFAGAEWTDAFLEGVYVAGGFRSREHRNKVAAAIKGDLLDTLTE